MEVNDVTYWRNGSVFISMVCLLLHFRAALFVVHPVGGTSDSQVYSSHVYHGRAGPGRSDEGCIVVYIRLYSCVMTKSAWWGNPER